jgi:hypothetical protein
MTFSGSNKQLRSEPKSRLLVGKTFTFVTGLLQREVSTSHYTSIRLSYDELVSSGVFALRDVFPDSSPERSTFSSISFIPFSQHQDIRASNRVLYMDDVLMQSSMVVKVEDGLACVRRSTDTGGRAVAVPLDYLRLEFRIGDVVEIPPEDSNTWQPLGSHPRTALLALASELLAWRHLGGSGQYHDYSRFESWYII